MKKSNDKDKYKKKKNEGYKNGKLVKLELSIKKWKNKES
jgi:hypothetical protein